MWDPEKPWYGPMLTAFLSSDVVRVLGISPGSVSRDILTLEKRMVKEGESFLTKTLPSLGKAIDLALQGHKPLVTREFRKKSRRDARPAFLWALLRLVFDDTGRVARNPNLDAIRLLRQICFWFKKVELGYDDIVLSETITEFKELDASLPLVGTIADDRILVRARALITYLFRKFPDECEWRPRHGPGAVASGDNTIEKRCKLGSTLYLELDRIFPWWRWLNYTCPAPDGLEMGVVETKRFGLSKTAFVEKDSSGPRQIGLEPTEYMWVQQALKGALYEHIENHVFTKGHVNFTNQDINRELTKKWELYDTLDMSKASDRVSLALVESLFRNTKILPYLLASRTPGTILPNGEIFLYRKFAPMGSATCFPVEALVFYALAYATLVEQGVARLLARRHIFVYGDDIIVPHGFYAALSESFGKYYLKFNELKCCVHGKFRESCGLDSFDGVDVSPLRLKKAYPKRGPIDIIPLIQHSNMLYERGYRSSASFLRRRMFSFKGFKSLKKKIPYSSRRDLPILSFVDDFADNLVVSHKDSMSYVKGLVYVAHRDVYRAGDETNFFQEYLALGGPVGVLSPRCPMDRAFTRRYDGRLAMRKMVIPS